MVLKTSPYDAAEYLQTAEEQAFYLEAAFEDGDPALIALALGDVARARGMTELSRETGVSRAALYKSLAEGGNPRLSTLTEVLKALGFQLTVKPV
jgi:probable addiction module antidote protein